MFLLKVTSECNGCGICSLSSKYFEEDASGYAKPVNNGVVEDSDLKSVKQVISDCPCRAIEIIEEKKTSEKGNKALKDLYTKMEKELKAIKIPDVSINELKFVADDYHIDIPYSSNEYNNKYKSESEARSAARREFESKLYSDSAMRAILKKVFVEYKLKVLKPYMLYERDEKGFYTKYNIKVEKILTTYYAETKRVVGNLSALGDNWDKFEVYPAKGGEDITGEINTVAFFENRSQSSGIMREMHSDQYTSLNYYIDSMDFDYMEEYSGEGFFGSKTKKKWCFTGFTSAATEFVKDLKSAISLADPGIEESAEDCVNTMVNIYRDKFDAEINKKLNEYKKLL